MKPVTRNAMPSAYFLQLIKTGSVIAHIKGSTKALDEAYRDCTVVLCNKENLQPIAVRKPDGNCNYSFLGLNTDLKTFIVAFDNKKQYNAVIQDNLVPK